MDTFELLADAVRRRILEVLADGERPAGAVAAVIQREFGVTQPAVSAQLRVLREGGLANVRPAGARPLYSVNPARLREVDAWLERYRRFWNAALDALDDELARSQPAGRRGAATEKGDRP